MNRIDRSTLRMRLQGMDIDALEALWSELVELATGGVKDQLLPVPRIIGLVESTDARRGGFLRELLHVPAGLPDLFLPSSAPGRLYPHVTFRYRCSPGMGEPRFYLDNPYRTSRPLDMGSAKTFLQNATADQPVQLGIEGSFGNLPADWNVLVTPVIGQGHLPPGLGLPANTKWVLSCSTEVKASAILNDLGGQPVVDDLTLVVAEDKGAVSLLEGWHVGVCDPFQAPEWISALCNNSDPYIRPEKNRLIGHIVSLCLNAEVMVQRARRHSVEIPRRALEMAKARNEWEKMILDEKRMALIENRIEVLAYPLRQPLLAFSGERSSRIDRYCRTQLVPRVLNFINGQLIEMRLEANRSVLQDTVASRSSESELLYFRAGLLYALPTLALLVADIPLSMRIMPSPVEMPSGSAIAAPGVHGPSANFGILQRPIDSAKGFIQDIVRNTLGPMLKGIEGQLRGINETLFKIATLLVCTQLALAIGAAIAAAVTFSGTLGLHKLEDAIEDLLDKTKSSWPEIERRLVELLPMLDGEVDVKLAARAKQVVDRINQLVS